MREGTLSTRVYQRESLMQKIRIPPRIWNLNCTATEKLQCSKQYLFKYPFLFKWSPKPESMAGSPRERNSLPLSGGTPLREVYSGYGVHNSSFYIDSFNMQYWVDTITYTYAIL